MSARLIDWELLTRLTWPPGLGQAAKWDDFAERYDGYGRLSERYVPAQVAALGLQPHETLLDVGAGAGRLAIPAARVARHVTALDVSSHMLAALRSNARAAGVDNIDTVQLGWEAVTPGENLVPHDVVLLSRSPAMCDLVKVDALARRAAFVMVYSGRSLKGFHDELVAGIQPVPPPGEAVAALAPHVLVFNRLIDMGIEARVDYLDDGFDKWYPDEAAAVADFAWLRLPPGSESRFRDNLLPWLQAEEGGVRLRMATRSAVVWWQK